MLKTIILLILILNASEINATSYQKHKTHLKEKTGYKPYTLVLDQEQIKCLTDNIYFEAGNQSELGKKAVAFVTLNRSNNDRFPSNICDVVYQRNKWRCQFSWVCKSNKKIKYWNAYEESKNVAKHVMLNYDNMQDVTHGATFFHRNDIKKPWFNARITKTVSIGKHIFYKI
jgi:spore germination cell wall hydrolase CwlJ-like protein